MTFLFELLISFLLIAGGFFSLVGSYGLVKLNELMPRLHAPTKATTLGVGSILIASMLYFALIENDFSFHELMITIFLFLTAPITANFVAKAYLHRQGADDELPDTQQDSGWATFDEPKRGTAHPLPPEE